MHVEYSALKKTFETDLDQASLQDQSKTFHSVF